MYVRLRSIMSVLFLRIESNQSPHLWDSLSTRCMDSITDTALRIELSQRPRAPRPPSDADSSRSWLRSPLAARSVKRNPIVSLEIESSQSNHFSYQDGFPSPKCCWLIEMGTWSDWINSRRICFVGSWITWSDESTVKCSQTALSLLNLQTQSRKWIPSASALLDNRVQSDWINQIESSQLHMLDSHKRSFWLIEIRTWSDWINSHRICFVGSWITWSDESNVK